MSYTQGSGVSMTNIGLLPTEVCQQGVLTHLNAPLRFFKLHVLGTSTVSCLYINIPTLTPQFNFNQ